MAYESAETGTPEVYVREFQRAGGRRQVSAGGGRFACWPRNVKELFYLSGLKLMAVDVKVVGSNFEPGVPRMLFEKPLVGFEVSRDGQRFLIAVPVEEGSSAPITGSSVPITVVLNWTADLKR